MRWTHAQSFAIVMDMKLYFSPLACSLSSRIVLYELGKEATFIEVDKHNAELRAINPLAQVPTLVTDDGEVITENSAILQFLGANSPLVPQGGIARTRLHEWLSFIGTELHKSIYVPLLDSNAPQGAKDYALSKATPRLATLARRLEGRQFALDELSVADAYLVAILNWSTVTPVDLAPYPAITSYRSRMHERPSVLRAMAEEYPLYAKRSK